MRGLVLLVMSLGATTCAQACSVPVFRYALERWEPSRYEILVFHPKSFDKTKLLDPIETTLSKTNARIVPVNLDSELSALHKELWAKYGNPENRPTVLVRFPDSKLETLPAWKGPWDDFRATTMFDSPGRQAIAKMLLEGHTAVFVLLNSGKPEADQSAKEKLQKQIDDISKRIILPKPTEEGPQVKSTLPLRVSFPILEINRTAAETGLVSMLLNCEDGLVDINGPIAFPVFGRGRVLTSFHGKDLEKPGELRRAMEFLCGGCSCTVKELNPGMDLLMTATWDDVFKHGLTGKADVGPMPRVVDEIKGIETKPGLYDDAEIKRNPPPEGYQVVEVITKRDGTPDNDRAMPLTKKYALYGAGLIAILSLLWIITRRKA